MCSLHIYSYTAPGGATLLVSLSGASRYFRGGNIILSVGRNTAFVRVGSGSSVSDSSGSRGPVKKGNCTGSEQRGRGESAPPKPSGKGVSGKRLVLGCRRARSSSRRSTACTETCLAAKELRLRARSDWPPYSALFLTTPSSRERLGTR